MRWVALALTGESDAGPRPGVSVGDGVGGADVVPLPAHGAGVVSHDVASAALQNSVCRRSRSIMSSWHASRQPVATYHFEMA